MECVVYGLEHTVDLLGCDEQAVRRQLEEVSSTLQASSSSSPASKKKATDWRNRDYAKLHDEFIESLLQEQEQETTAAAAAAAQAIASCHNSNNNTNSNTNSNNNNNNNHMIPPAVLTSSSSSSSLTFTDARRSSPSRRRRPLKLSRRSPTKNRSRQVLPLPSISLHNNSNNHSRRGSKSQSKSVSHDDDHDDDDDDDDLSLVSQITKRSLPAPSEYLFSKCRLQKDKGKGISPIGSDICATTRDDCLVKLRSKMELLTQVCGNSNSAQTQSTTTSSMKRRKAKVTEETVTYTETRSVMDLRMGFLSMQYGVLLRWDTTMTGKVVLVVLRKMAHDSFYRKDCVKPKRPGSNSNSRHRQVPECHDPNHLVVVRPDGTEVTLLGEPYRVPRPLATAPAVLELTVVSLADFSERSTWTVQVAMNGGDAQTNTYGGINQSPLRFEWMDNALHVELTVLIYEKRPRQKRKRLVSSTTLALNLLEVSRQLAIPGTIVFQVALQSTYSQWLQSELQAQQQAQSSYSSSSHLCYPIVNNNNNTVVPQEDEPGLWELCCVW